MQHKINSIDEYKLYLKKQLSAYIKDEKKLNICVDEMYLAFLDGVKFGHGRLKVEL